MRARTPEIEGSVEHDGVEIGYEVFGTGPTTVLLLPTWTIVHSRFWKMQVPFLAERHRVVTFDRPGNGRSGRPTRPEPYRVSSVVDQARRVLDATGTDRAVTVSLSRGTYENLALAAEHPDRVLGAAFIGVALVLEPDHPGRAAAVDHFLDPAGPDASGWDRLNAQYWTEHYDGFADFWFSQCFSGPHSTKQREDCVG